ncbi:hypothetical protein [Sphingomonas sp. BK580]|uniref:hypothetical protein n=1 Tax=Sphingomonas sp. BK580 TaxID=2586972 RepID=UPI00161A450B|nr:hypothetical protein [Sphingomonas sp. BK580]MBB3695196.1 hypothetical protein [Sphingomonas sp. BK580]
MTDQPRPAAHRSAPLPQPTGRRLRVYAFDPSAAIERGSATFSQAIITLAWNDPTEDPLQPGPINDYLEVVDIDPVSQQFYEPIDLNHPDVLAQDGLPPSEGDPRFHQQMVFAVAMKTIKQFERALGRKVTWRPAWDKNHETYRPTDRLRVYPHALREANAYYSREKRALLFGYFKASQRKAGASWIFTALSHDIIVHETTHAILDGLHPRYSDATSIDSLAFHEAFADISALFSHFQLTEAVSEHIARQGGKLDQQSNLLSGLAQQFASGTSDRKALRDYIDKAPDPDALAGTAEPHERGAILVAAVFDAFLTIYAARSTDLMRIGGVQPGQPQRLHPDLVARLASEARKSADHVLRMCIRALDYLPPVDVRFGEFLRAIVTADADLIPDDTLNYRLAFIEAFRRRGIFPDNCLSLSPDNLLWSAAPIGPDGQPLSVDDVESGGLDLMPRFKRGEVLENAEANRRRIWYWLVQPELEYVPEHGVASESDKDRLAKLLARLREDLANGAAESLINGIRADLLWIGLTADDLSKLEADLAYKDTHFQRWLAIIDLIASGRALRVRRRRDVDRAWERSLGIYFEHPDDPKLYTLGTTRGNPSVEVSSVRSTRRAGPDGQDARQLIVEITQRRRGYLDADEQHAEDAREPVAGEEERPYDFHLRGGATLIIDLRTRALRYVISKSISDDARLASQRDFLLRPAGMGMVYDQHGQQAEPFALLHRY